VPESLLPGLAPFIRTLACVIALLLLLLNAGVVREPPGQFNPQTTCRAEFYVFFLLSIMGLMLTTTATDLIWLFLALELTSLPTYIMVAVSRPSLLAREAAVKYFFLGAFGAAIFLYGFALLYGGTGTLHFADMARVFAVSGVNGLALAGMIVAVLGVGFKIAAVPMHLYTPDVYQGAASSVSAFLAFVPKTAGFVALLLLLSTVSAAELAMPAPLQAVLVAMAAVTMIFGNVLALLQTNIKRILAYSSIAHSGYMLIGVIAGPGDGSLISNGYAAVAFYLLTYGFMNLGAFGVLASLQRKGVEIEDLPQLKGLCRTNPLLGWTMVFCAASLLGLPPLIGFFGKLYLFAVGISNGFIGLVIIAGINSAIAAFYYLRLAVPPIAHEPTDESRDVGRMGIQARVIASAVSALSVLVLVAPLSLLVDAAGSAGLVRELAVLEEVTDTPLDTPAP
jgi:NADH-quinone oxidoreductase subunit N